VVSKIAAKFTEFASRETIEVDVPVEKLSWIIGTGGKKRMELEAEYDVTIYVPQINRGAAKGNEKVKVTGKPEQNEKAKKAIHVWTLWDKLTIGYCENWRWSYCACAAVVTSSRE
jgi:hypothetical protein